jgi:chemotaxis protein methyltransferase CheR
VKYFDRVGTEWQIKKCIRDMVELRQMNLVEPWPAIPPVDVLFIRNVLIYFDVPTKKAILQSVRQNLARHAYLVLGGAETTLNIDDAFERVPGCPSTVFQRAAAK